MTVAPIAIKLIESAIHDWVVDSTGIPGNRVIFVEPRDAGAPDVPLPAALIQCTSLIPIGQPEIRVVPSIVQQKITVLAAGPATFEVVLYVGVGDDEGTEISYDAGPGEAIEDVAAGLLAQLDAELPAGITAAADPDDDASILVDGTAEVPMFVLAPDDDALLEVTHLRERFPELECQWSRMVWRVTFRSEQTRSFGSAFDYMARARAQMKRRLTSRIHAAGWKYAGVLLADPTDFGDRNESQATFDFALEGYSTVAFQTPAARGIEIALSA